jgi:hypothetical protein
MSVVFRNIDPHHLTALRVHVPPPPAFGAGGGHTRWVERGWGVNSSEDARHCSVLCTLYSVLSPVSTLCCRASRRMIQMIFSDESHHVLSEMLLCLVCYEACDWQNCRPLLNVIYNITKCYGSEADNNVYRGPAPSPSYDLAPPPLSRQ